jgi:hypothetical protein
MEFRSDPTEPGRRVWRSPAAPALLSGLGVAILGIMTLTVVALALVFGGQPGGRTLMLVVLPTALVMAALTLYVWRDMRGKLRGAIVLDEAGVRLDLPGGRSLVHNPPACHETVPYADVAAVETRLETYPAQAMAMTQRAYRLTRRGGPAIFLFEERALGTFLAAGTLRPLAEEIARRSGAPLNDLGMVRGGGGLLGAWFVRVPDWSAPPVAPAQQAALLRRSRLTGVLALAAVVVVVIILVVSHLH